MVAPECHQNETMIHITQWTLSLVTEVQIRHSILIYREGLDLKGQDNAITKTMSKFAHSVCAFKHFHQCNVSKGYMIIYSKGYMIIYCKICNKSYKSGSKSPTGHPGPNVRWDSSSKSCKRKKSQQHWVR